MKFLIFAPSLKDSLEFMKKLAGTLLASFILFPLLFFVISCNKSKAADVTIKKNQSKILKSKPVTEKKSLTIDSLDYNKRMLALANNDNSGRWPAKAPYPMAGALLPYHRIVAYYGNLYSKNMGILGELPRAAMIKKLQSEVAKWQAADSTLKAIPALHYIAVTAQGAPGKGNLHRMRMPFKQIDTVLKWAKPIDALVFLDIQVGHSTIKEEVTALESYLRLPHVHLGIDPEFSLKNGEIPGTKIGTFTSDDINAAIDILANLVRKNKLTPKILVVHRFTQRMVTGYKNIKKVPEVQIVMDMDGFGDKILKKSSYRAYIYREPVQFAGIKLFYKNDIKKSAIYTPKELLQFTPKPIYIQYQ